MRLLIQRVSQASVTVDGQCVGSIQQGLLIFLGVHREDTEAQADWLSERLLNFRLFPDAEGKMGRSIVDIEGELLIVSQFTLYGDLSKGRRPDFTQAAPPLLAENLYEYFLKSLKRCGLKVECGRFGAMMQVSLTNEGPVTFCLER